MKKKLKNSAGFSLVEMLCAVAVLMLLCVMLNSALSVAMKTYFDLTAESETQLLLNSLTNAIAGELRYAYGVKGTENPTYNPYAPVDNPTDTRSLNLKLQDGRVLVAGGPDGDKDLLPIEKNGRGGAYKNGDYQVDEMKIVYDESSACFTVNLKVSWKDSGISAQTPEDGVVIRCLNPPEESEEGEDTL